MSGPVDVRRIGLDPRDMTGRVVGLPRQLRDAGHLRRTGRISSGHRARDESGSSAWEEARSEGLPSVVREAQGRVAVTIVRGYELPGAAADDVFGLFVSYSGNTEETLTAWDEAERRGLPRAAITSGSPARAGAGGGCAGARHPRRLPAALGPGLDFGSPLSRALPRGPVGRV